MAKRQTGNDSQDVKLRDLGRLSIDEFIDKVAAAKTQAEQKLGYKVEQIVVTFSATPSVVVTLKPKS